MPKISAVGLFSCDKFEETPKQKVINMSKLNKFYFSIYTFVNRCTYYISAHADNAHTAMVNIIKDVLIRNI